MWTKSSPTLQTSTALGRWSTGLTTPQVVSTVMITSAVMGRGRVTFQEQWHWIFSDVVLGTTRAVEAALRHLIEARGCTVTVDPASFGRGRPSIVDGGAGRAEPGVGAGAGASW